jgi:hypothetical protein
MYRDNETGFSRDYLKEILSSLPQPFCLMGGWSVYLTLNEKFERTTGREYPGSRDIDLGFHLDPNWTPNEFENSSMGKAIEKIESMGFEPESFRFVKQYHLSEKRELTVEERRRLPQYEIFNLYIDFLVDSQDPNRFKVAGFNVLEEPLLERVFSGADRVTTKLEGVDVVMPSPKLLVEMKIKSFPGRTQDDKRTKDLIDLCGLLLFSGVQPLNILKNPEGLGILDRYERALEKTKEEEWERAALSLDLTASAVRRAARSVR